MKIYWKIRQFVSDVQFLMKNMFNIIDIFTIYSFMIFSKKMPRKISKNSKVSVLGRLKNGKDIWIRYIETFISGVKVENSAIIGTNSLVTKNIFPYEI